MTTTTSNKSESTLRWAVGSLEGPRSSVWRIWTQKKGDFYVAVRNLGHITKASFHRDGKCHFGFTKEYQRVAESRFAVQSRHAEKWTLPDEHVVRVLQIMVPHSELRQNTIANDADISWLQPPPNESIATITILVSKPGIDLDLANNSSGSMFGKLSTDIRTIWLAYMSHRPDSALESLILMNVRS